MSTPELETIIEPLGDRVVVLPNDAERISKSGIIIPDSAQKDAPQEGVVVAVGKGGIDHEGVDPRNFLLPGEVVIFGKYVGDDIKVRNAVGEDIIVKILHLDSILGKVS